MEYVDNNLLIYKKFRDSLPSSVSNDTIDVVMKWCFDRLDYKNQEILLRENIIVEYGEPYHIFGQGLGPFINVHSAEDIGITWVFNSRTGESVAT